MILDGDPEINRATYEWSVRVVTTLKKLLHVNIELHSTEGQLEAGDIFVFNHFARFETFIPQYLIYQRTGALCRSVAASELFAEGSAFSNYLLEVGAVPTNYPRLLPFLAGEILRGRKVIIFPEGHMIKDRQVLDGRGRYSVYSRTGGPRLRPRTGAAVLALVLDAFKTAVLSARESGNTRFLEAWAESLRLKSVEALLAAALRPTLIVPANITFYPIRASDNLLHKVAELLNRGLSRRVSEELLIEGNILLKDTDMDVRLGDPVQPAWSWWERKLAVHLVGGTDSLQDLFGLTRDGKGWKRGLLAQGMRRKAGRMRDKYAREMYTSVSVNLSHVASQTILTFLKRRQDAVDQPTFHRALYLAVRNLQKESSIHLHRSVGDPEEYGSLIGGRCSGLEQFFATALSLGLVTRENEVYRFSSRLREKHDFDSIRLGNLVVVYANEVAPLPQVKRSVEQAMDQARSLSDEDLARMRFDDEIRSYAWDKQQFSRERYREINQQQTATESGEPFLWLPEKSKDIGVVLVHGLLASPAEVRSFGEQLRDGGYAVIGVRLKGHGTSPWDLRDRTWRDWLESVRRGYAILSAFAGRICLVGFSTGAALSLHLASARPARLAGVAAVSVPLKMRDRGMIFVPFLHGANRLARWVPAFEGVMPFRSRVPEHPHINYRHLPIRSLFELQRLVSDLEDRLPAVECPVVVIQGSDDPIVDPKSAALVLQKLGSSQRRLLTVSAQRHGILNEDIGGTRQIILSFLNGLA